MPSHAGSFLVASPKVIVPAFHQSVVLLLRHDTQGALGLIVNQPGTDRKGLPFVVFSGGPCEAQGLLLLHGHPGWHDAFLGTVAAPGIFLGDLKKVSEAPEAGYRFRAFVYYSCRVAGPLDSELAGGA
jgi:putative transcriptional regulator